MSTEHLILLTLVFSFCRHSSYTEVSLLLLGDVRKVVEAKVKKRQRTEVNTPYKTMDSVTVTYSYMALYKLCVFFTVVSNKLNPCDTSQILK